MIDKLNEKAIELGDIIDNAETGLKVLLAEENTKLTGNQKDHLSGTEKVFSKATKVLQKFNDWPHAKTGPRHYEEKAGKDSDGDNAKRTPEASTADPEETGSATPPTQGPTRMAGSRARSILRISGRTPRAQPRLRRGAPRTPSRSPWRATA